MTIAALDVFGSYRGPTGYDHHTREFVRELHRQGVAIRLYDTGSAAEEGWSPPEVDAWFASLNRPVPAQVALHFRFPHEVQPQPGRLNVNHTMFEATPAPPIWVDYGRRLDAVLLPSESSRQAWLAGGMRADKIRLCPLGVDPVLFGQPVLPLPLRRDNGVPAAEYRVRFLNVSVAGPRKNLQGLFRVWLRATSCSDSAILLLKLGFYWPGDYEIFRSDLEATQNQLGKRLHDAAPVLLVNDILSDAAMARLYAAATHYVSLSHGEGWDLPMMEAAAAGLRLIAPDHSAYQDYLDGQIADLIPSRRVPAQFPANSWFGMLFQNTQWWEPDEDAAVALVRAAIDGTEAPKASPRGRILRDFSWEQSTRRLIEVLSELEQRGRTDS